MSKLLRVNFPFAAPRCISNTQVNVPDGFFLRALVLQGQNLKPEHVERVKFKVFNLTIFEQGPTGGYEDADLISGGQTMVRMGNLMGLMHHGMCIQFIGLGAVPRRDACMTAGEILFLEVELNASAPADVDMYAVQLLEELPDA